MQLYVAPKISKYPAWWLPRYPNFHNVTILFELSCEILAQWSLHGSLFSFQHAEKPIPNTERSWQGKCEYPWIFRNTLNLMQSSYFFHLWKKRGSLELWEGVGLCVSSHQFILEKSNENYCKKYPKSKTPPSRGQSPCQGCPHKSCNLIETIKSALDFKCIFISESQLTSWHGYLDISKIYRNIRVLIYIYIYYMYIIYIYIHIHCI